MAASEKVRAHLDNLANPSFLRSYKRGGYWWNIVSWGGEGDTLKIVVEVREGTPLGKVVVAPTDDLNPMCITNPFDTVPDGFEPNPDHNPTKLTSLPLRPKLKKDAVEALRMMLERHLENGIG